MVDGCALKRADVEREGGQGECPLGQIHRDAGSLAREIGRGRDQGSDEAGQSAGDLRCGNANRDALSAGEELGGQSRPRGYDQGQGSRPERVRQALRAVRPSRGERTGLSDIGHDHGQRLVGLSTLGLPQAFHRGAIQGPASDGVEGVGWIDGQRSPTQTSSDLDFLLCGEARGAEVVSHDGHGGIVQGHPYNARPLIERLLTRWPAFPRGLSMPLSLLTLLVWTGAMALVVRNATEQTALALTSDLAAYGERARWSGIYYRGEKIGFSVSQMTERPGGFKLQEDGQMLLTLMGATTASKLHTEVNVDPQYLLQDFAFSLDPGTGPISIKGALEAPTRLAVRISSPTGSERSRTFDLKAPPVLALNLPKRLLALGLQEGLRHQIQIFDPATLTNGLANIEVGPREVVRILDKPVPAFKLTMTYSGITATSWITEVGEVVKEESAMGMVVVRESRERATALAMSSEVKTDMIESAAIQPESKRNIDDAASLSSLRLEFSGAALPGTPEEQNGAGQTVTGNVVDIEDARGLKQGPAPADIKAWLAPEAFIESDAPEIIAETAKALERAGGKATARKKAEMLVRYVNAVLEKKPTMSLPSAVEVLRTRVGDCNEHTALYVAMARSAEDSRPSGDRPRESSRRFLLPRLARGLRGRREIDRGRSGRSLDSRRSDVEPIPGGRRPRSARPRGLRPAGRDPSSARPGPDQGSCRWSTVRPRATPTALVGAENTQTPSLALDFPAPESKDSCWRRPARR